MFAVLLHESTNTFHYIATSFPTAIYTLLLSVCLIYWLFAALGLVDIEFLDFDMDGDIDSADSNLAQSGTAGLLTRFGLNGVPLTVIVSLISFIGWIASYYFIYFGSRMLPNVDLIELAFEIFTLVASFFLAVFLTAQIIKPLRRFLKTMEADETKHILGQNVIVRSSTVTETNGEGLINVRGADILLNIRSAGTDKFSKGDHVVAIEKINESNLYRVISKAEFENTP